MADAILMAGGTGGVGSDDVTAGKAQVLQGYKTVTTDSDDEIVEGTVQVIDTAQDNYSKTRTTEFGLLKDRNTFYMNLPQRNAFYTRADNRPHVEIVADAFGDATQYQLLEGSTATSKNGVKFSGTFPKKSDTDSRDEFWLFKNFNGKDVYVTRIPESAYVRYYDQGGSQGWDPWVRVSRELVKAGVNYHPEKTLDDTVTCDEQGQIPVKPNENMTTEIVNISWTNPKKMGFRFPQGYYPNSGQYAPIVEVNYQDLANAIGIRADKMMNDTNVLGIQGNLPYWVCYTGDVISSLNNEGFVWDDTYAGRGRGIVVKIPNSHVIAGANYVFLPSPNLQPWNIRQNVNVNGITGTMVDYGAGGQAFRAATFDGRLLTGVANKGFILRGIGRYLNLKNINYGYQGIVDGGLKFINGFGENTRFKSAPYIGCVFANSVNLTPFRFIKFGFKVFTFRGDGTGSQPARIELEVGATSISSAGGETYHNESNTVVRDIGGWSKSATYTMTSTKTNAGNQSDMSQQYLTLDVSASQGHHFIYIMLGNIVHEYSGGSVYAVVVVNNIEFIN